MRKRNPPTEADLERHLEGLFPKAFAERWSAASLDLKPDAQQWVELPPARRERILRTMALFAYFEHSVTQSLGPIIIAASHNRERRFLASQLGDEAHHEFFFSRLFAEVFGLPNGLDDIRGLVGNGAATGFFSIFDIHLQSAVDLLLREPSNMEAWAKAVLIYHIVIEGIVAQGAQLRMLKFFKTKEVLPGVRAGFEGLLHDESRHTSWGVTALELCVLRMPSLVEPLVGLLHALAEPVVLALVDPDLRQPKGSRFRLPDWRETSVEDKLACRLGTIGFPDDAKAGVLSAFAAQFERQWDKHRDLHGVEHDGRVYYQSRTQAST